MPDRRACKATNRAGGPCGCAPLTDKDHCSAHDRTRTDDDRFGSPSWSARAGASEKPRVPKLIEAMARLIEEEAEEWLAVLTAARDADRGVVVGNGPTAELVEIPDHDVRLKALTTLLDRVVGRPKQAVEHTGTEGEPIRLEADAETRELAHMLLLRMAGMGDGDRD